MAEMGIGLYEHLPVYALNVCTNILPSTTIASWFSHYENLRRKSYSVTTDVGSNSFQALDLLLPISSALVLAPNIDSTIDLDLLAIRKAFVALPKAKISFWYKGNCQSGVGSSPDTEISNVAFGTCQAALKGLYSYHPFGSAIAEADVPSGFDSTLRIHSDNWSFNTGNRVVAQGAPDVCVPTPGIGAYKAFWECSAV